MTVQWLKMYTILRVFVQLLKTGNGFFYSQKRNCDFMRYIYFIRDMFIFPLVT